VEWVEEPSYFFRLSEWQEKLLEYYNEHPDFIGPDSRRNEVMRFVEGGLRDLSISRSSFKWGVPVPGHPEHVMYVWVEALVNYLTVLDFPDMESDAYHTFWKQATHILGKDIIRHHAVYWPALLMAAEIPLPKRIFAHGWWTREGQKISKSVGNVIDPIELVKRYGVDPVRYFLMREVPFGKDGDFSETAFKHRVNGDLANDLGNLSQRVLSFVQKQADAKTPAWKNLVEADHSLLVMAKALPEQILAFADKQEIHKICEAIWAVVGEANRYVDAMQPWALKKTDVERMNSVLFVLMETIRRVAIVTQPIMPDSCGRILDALAVPKKLRDFASLNTSLKVGTPLPVPEPIFPRIE
jgi:methionyl-tRNA synthetase